MTQPFTVVTNTTLLQANAGLNGPEEFRLLKPELQGNLVDWIQHVLVPAKKVFPGSSYGMKHEFEREPDGFHVVNGAFKGAMLEAGFIPVNQAALNWLFRVKPVSELGRWEKQQRGLIGRGWLVRNRWREKGYEVLEPTQRARALQHSEDCWRGGRPQIVVLRGKGVAKISLDMAPAGRRLSPEAVAAIHKVFEEFDPRHRSPVNDQQALIRRVPLYRAEEVAAALVSIVTGCSS